MLYLGVKPKRGWYVLRLFFKIGLFSAISFKRSQRELSMWLKIGVEKLPKYA